MKSETETPDDRDGRSLGAEIEPSGRAYAAPVNAEPAARPDVRISYVLHVLLDYLRASGIAD